MEPSGTVLLVVTDDQPWEETRRHLREEGYRVLARRCGRDALSLAEESTVDLVFCEERVGEEEGVSILQRFRLAHPTVLRVLVREAGSLGALGPALRRAAIYQTTRKPLDPQQIGLLVRRALETRELARRHRLLSRELKLDGEWPALSLAAEKGRDYRHFDKLVYASERMAAVCQLAREAAGTDLPVLIQGETGTGKELLARAIHHHSARNDSPLLVQNCGGVPDELLQSELFGHVRGAFTGAVADRTGLFRAGDGGTVFLDEISDVSPAFQVSLLRFLQFGEVKPLGSDRVLSCDVRIIAATNRPLRELVRQGRFRKDLYYRLKGFEITIPPLRDRREDIPVLADFFLAKYSQSLNKRILGITRDVLEIFRSYPFPGNVRELENEVRRMVAVTGDGSYLTRRALSPELQQIEPPRARRSAIHELEGRTLKEKVENLEKRLVAEALERYRWNQSRAAGALGLSRVGLANKIRRYGLLPSRGGSDDGHFRGIPEG